MRGKKAKSLRGFLREQTDVNPTRYKYKLDSAGRQTRTVLATGMRALYRDVKKYLRSGIDHAA